MIIFVEHGDLCEISGTGGKKNFNLEFLRWQCWNITSDMNFLFSMRISNGLL